jgi:hypothetical protein
MAHDTITAVRIREALAGRKVIEQPMMGALCFMVDGHMCCCTKDDTIMVRVGAEAHEQMLAEPHVQSVEMRGRRLAGFVRVAAADYASDTALKKWIGRGLDFVATLPPKKAPKRPKAKGA